MQENKDLSSTKYGDQTWRFPSAFPSLTAFLTRAAMAMGEESQWEVAEIAKELQDHTAAWLHISVTVWECASRYWNLRARTFSLEGHHFKSHVALNIWKYFEIYAKNSRSQLASGYSGDFPLSCLTNGVNLKSSDMIGHAWTVPGDARWFQIPPCDVLRIEMSSFCIRSWLFLVVHVVWRMWFYIYMCVYCPCFYVQAREVLPIRVRMYRSFPRL